MSEKTHLESVSASYRSRGTAFTDNPESEPTASGESFEGKQPIDEISDSPAGDLGFDPEPEAPEGGTPQDGTTVAEGETEPVPEAPVAEGDSTTE